MCHDSSIHPRLILCTRGRCERVTRLIHISNVRHDLFVCDIARSYTCGSCFERAGMYGEGGMDYGDNLFRFALFAWAALEAPLVVPCGGVPYGTSRVCVQYTYTYMHMYTCDTHNHIHAYM